MTDNSDGTNDGRSKKPKVSGNKDVSYTVGKNRPPVKHQFQHGNKGGGRKRGSLNKSPFEKLLEKRVTVGRDARNRPIRKPYGEVIDTQLIIAASNGDMRAIKIAKDFQLKALALGHNQGPSQPTVEELMEEARIEAERKEFYRTFSDMMRRHLDFHSLLKATGVLEYLSEKRPFTDYHLAQLNLALQSVDWTFFTNPHPD